MRRGLSVSSSPEPLHAFILPSRKGDDLGKSPHSWDFSSSKIGGFPTDTVKQNVIVMHREETAPEKILFFNKDCWEPEK